jgi:plastocyanin
VLLLAAIPVTFACSQGRDSADLATKEVTIDARCTGGDNTSITLRPWNLKVRQGDTVNWVLNANANSNDVTITAKREAWPFAEAPPYKGAKGKPARSGAMRPNARGRYSYNVSLICTNGARSDTVLIDPDIIVD